LKNDKINVEKLTDGIYIFMLKGIDRKMINKIIINH